MIKKIFTIFALLLVLVITSCENSTSVSVNLNDLNKDTSEVDIDLREMSSTMVYTEVYNMMMYPEDYLGKTVAVEGEFTVYNDSATGKNYYAVIIADALACCSQGLEFVWEGEHIYPDEYPKVGEKVQVVGTFKIYEENGINYNHIATNSVVFGY
ncbi:MAG: hypothetical protein ACK5LY_05370 [Lachnospirales bacterium]